MPTVAQIRTKLADKIFTPYSKTVTLQHDNGHTYDNRGSISAYSWSTSSIGIVTYDLVNQRASYQNFSNFPDGEVYAAIPYSVTISTGDRIIIDSDTWEVREVLKHLLPENAVFIVRLVKIVA